MAEGAFIRGSNNGEPGEKPKREVWLDGYWIDTYEVSVEDYKKCVDAGRCSVPEKKNAYDNWEVVGRKKHPVNSVTWRQAADYCRWAGKRLPTEAEWEKAARGTGGLRYPWGNEKPSCRVAVIHDGCGEDGTWVVGLQRRGKSPYGVYDMTGNVWEWVSDWYGEGHYAKAPYKNPTGPDNGDHRILKGGGWNSVGDSLRAAIRNFGDGSSTGADIGFRCAVSN